MKNIFSRCLAIVALFLGYSAAAQDSLVEQVYEACQADVQSFCGQVTPGEGRMLYCMAAHEDKISGRCEYALYQAASVLEQVAAAIAYVARECQTDIQTLCGDVKQGDGRIMLCLDKNADDVSDACKQAAEDITSD